MTKVVHGYGRLPDPPDERDHKIRFGVAAVQPPPHIDLSSSCPPVWDQGQTSSCTAFASLAGAMFMLRGRVRYFTPSWLANYYWTRGYEHTTQEDSGAYIRDAIKTLANYGAPHGSLWPYVPSKLTRKPPPAVEKSAAQHRITGYLSVLQDLGQMRSCLAQGRPIVIGFTVYESFESQKVAETGVVAMPKRGEQAIGGHAVLIVGYDDATRRFKFRNSWGPDWGDEGYGYFDFDYLTNPDLAGDFWTITAET